MHKRCPPSGPCSLQFRFASTACYRRSTSSCARQGRSTIRSVWKKHNLMAIVSAATSLKSFHLTVMESAPPVNVCAYRDDRFAVRSRGTRWLLVPKTWRRGSMSPQSVFYEARGRTHPPPLTAISLDVNITFNFSCG